MKIDSLIYYSVACGKQAGKHSFKCKPKDKWCCFFLYGQT